MSVAIRWRPTSESGKRFSCGTSSSLDALTRTFGETIGPKDIAALRAMANATNDGFYDEVADTIESVGEIKVWGEW